MNHEREHGGEVHPGLDTGNADMGGSTCVSPRVYAACENAFCLFIISPYGRAIALKEERRIGGNQLRRSIVRKSMHPENLANLLLASQYNEMQDDRVIVVTSFRAVWKRSRCLQRGVSRLRVANSDCLISMVQLPACELVLTT
jgi:hypothetical protein